MGCGASVEDGDESNGLSLKKSEKGELSLHKTSCFCQLALELRRQVMINTVSNKLKPAD